MARQLAPDLERKARMGQDVDEQMGRNSSYNGSHPSDGEDFA